MGTVTYDRNLQRVVCFNAQLHTCSVTNSSALSNIWFPSKEVMAIKRNRPSSTEVGISVSGVGNISKDRAIRVLESKPDNLVSLTFTMLKTNILPSVTFHFVMFSSQTLCFYTQGRKQNLISSCTVGQYSFH